MIYEFWTKEGHFIIYEASLDYLNWGSLHREDGPAFIHYNLMNATKYESYFIDGKMHREDGPARVWFDLKGNINNENYYLYGRSHYKKMYNFLIKHQITGDFLLLSLDQKLIYKFINGYI